MAQLLGYLCSDDSLTAYAAAQVRQEAWQEPAHPWGATGLGWTQEGRTLLRKHPNPGEPVDMLGLLADVPARALVGHMSEQAHTPNDALDLQPFRFRQWIYAQTGEAPGFEHYRAAMLARTPDHLRRGIRGQSDAEVLFHRFYHWMCEHRALSPEGASGSRVARALGALVAELSQNASEAGHEGALGLNIVAATERLLIAACTGAPLYLRQFQGIEQPGEEPLFAGHRTRKIQRPHFRAAFLASGLNPVDGPWQRLEPGTISWVDATWQLHSIAIDESPQP